MNWKLIATGVICFGLGFISNKLLPTENTQTISPTITTKLPTNVLPTPAETPHSIIPSQTKSNSQLAPQIAEKISSKPLESNASSLAKAAATGTNKNGTTEPNNAGKVKFTQRIEISDESIDELVPKPFNSSVKHLQSDLKTKFANYLLAENQNDSEIQAENFLNDSLNRGQLSGIAEISYIGCKAGLCEVRLFEQSPNQTMPTILKQLTPYRDYFQEASSSMTSDGQRTSIHYLVSIKH